MDQAELDLGVRIDGLDCFRKPLEAINAGNENTMWTRQSWIWVSG
jgi:hypothetical protein